MPLKHLCLCLAALLLIGCTQSTSTIPYASSLPPEKTCTLNINLLLTVKNFDGQEVEWKAQWGDTWATVHIPEGSHTFVLEYKKQTLGRGASPGPMLTSSAITFTYDNFKAGRSYDLLGRVIGNTLRIEVHDVTDGRDWKEGLGV